MKRVLVSNPIEIRLGPSGQEVIQIEKIIELDNPEVSMPQDGSLGNVSSQPEIARTSGREGAPNPLADIITIYDEEESSKVSLVTPVQIIEEKEPEKASCPAPDVQFQSLQQRDQELKSVLDTDLLDAPNTQVDKPRDDLGLGEQE
jgi:hypothetical protein